MKRAHLAIQIFVAGFVATALCLAAAFPVARAQSPASRDDRPPNRPGPRLPVSEHPAHVRFWKTALPDFPNLRVTLSLTGTTTRQPVVAHDLGGGEPGYSFGSYADSPSGRGTISVFNTPVADSKKPEPLSLANLPVNIAPGSFVTVLLDEPRKVGDAPRLEVIFDDPSDGKGNDGAAQITVRSFVAEIKDMRVSLGETLVAQFTGRGGYLQMRGLRPDVYPVRTLGGGPGNKSFEWTTEADLRQHSHQTLLVYPDPYGRIRPRLIVDGESQADALDKEEGPR